MIPIPIVDPGLEPPYLRTKSLVMLLESYKKLQKLPIKKVFPGHYQIFENAEEVINAQMDRILQKTERTLNYIKEGVHSCEALMKLIYPKRVDNAIFFMVLGFLDILMERNQIHAIKENGILNYYPIEVNQPLNTE